MKRKDHETSLGDTFINKKVGHKEVIITREECSNDYWTSHSTITTLSIILNPFIECHNVYIECHNVYIEFHNVYDLNFF